MHFLRTRAALFALGGLLVVAVALGASLAIINATPEPTPAPSPTLSPSPTVSPSPSASPTPSPSPTASPSPSPTLSPSPTPSPTPVAVCPLNGTRLSDPALAERVPMLVSIENNPIARPPSGLNLADLVVEAPVEGNTTRWAAIFMCRDQVDAGVGPIRSVRYFHRDLWQQMRALTMHFGGAGPVLRSFQAVDMPYANGLSGGWGFFYRAGPWAAPHNVYLDVDAARAQMEEGGVLAGLAARAGDVRAPFEFADDPELPDGRAVNAIGFQTASFWNFGWQWDDRTQKWLRTDAGAPNYEALTGDRISTKTIIVQVVRQDVLIGENDPGGFPRLREYLVESGVGVLYLEGRGHDVRWSRDTPEDVTTWTYADSGDPVILPAGKTWWHIVPIGSGISEG